MYVCLSLGNQSSLVPLWFIIMWLQCFPIVVKYYFQVFFSLKVILSMVKITQNTMTQPLKETEASTACSEALLLLYSMVYMLIWMQYVKLVFGKMCHNKQISCIPLRKKGSETFNWVNFILNIVYSRQKQHTKNVNANGKIGKAKTRSSSLRFSALNCPLPY